MTLPRPHFLKLTAAALAFLSALVLLTFVNRSPSPTRVTASGDGVLTEKLIAAGPPNAKRKDLEADLHSRIDGFIGRHPSSKRVPELLVVRREVEHRLDVRSVGSAYELQHAALEGQPPVTDRVVRIRVQVRRVDVWERGDGRSALHCEERVGLVRPRFADPHARRTRTRQGRAPPART